MSKSKTNDTIENSSNIKLISGKGSAKRGGDPGGFYWHIYQRNSRVGYIFINIIDDTIIGRHPSIQIHINKNKRGEQLGRIAYRLACEESNYDKIYAHMRKSNLASKKAAQYAGFEVLENDSFSQLVMVWSKSN